jgi:hypothetical protein
MKPEPNDEINAVSKMLVNAMQCNAMQCNAMLCYAMLCYVLAVLNHQNGNRIFRSWYAQGRINKSRKHAACSWAGCIFENGKPRIPFTSQHHPDTIILWRSRHLCSVIPKRPYQSLKWRHWQFTCRVGFASECAPPALLPSEKKVECYLGIGYTIQIIIRENTVITFTAFQIKATTKTNPVHPVFGERNKNHQCRRCCNHCWRLHSGCHSIHS